MESLAKFDQDNKKLIQQQPTTSGQIQIHLQPKNRSTSSKLLIGHSSEPPKISVKQIQRSQNQLTEPSTSKSSNPQNSYQVKCSLLEYHIQEAVLINKALRSELKQYRDKIDFEKKLRKFLVNRVQGFQP